MHAIQEKLLQLSKRENLAQLTLRQMAAKIGMPGESPQKIKHHLVQLQKRGFLQIDRAKGMMERTSPSAEVVTGLLKKASRLFSIPVIGMANAGPANIFSEQNLHGFLRASSKLVGRSKPDGLFAIKVEGTSMNLAEVNGKKIENGDYVIVDKNDLDVSTNDVVLAIIENRGTIKRFVDDRENGQIVLRADSTFDYEPIYLHSDDDFTINGKVVGVIKRPKL
jgi:repressor LexA